MPDVLGGREERVNRRLRSLAPSDRYTDKQTLMLLSTSVMGMIADIAAQLGAPASRSHPPLPSQNHLALPTDMASNIFMHHFLAKAKLPLVLRYVRFYPCIAFRFVVDTPSCHRNDRILPHSLSFPQIFDDQVCLSFGSPCVSFSCFSFMVTVYR